MKMKHGEMIVCIPADCVQGRSHGLVDYVLKPADVMLGQRAMLEKNENFRQVIPVNIFTHEGKVWSYRRTPSGGESRLHGAITPCIGGHFDAEDVVMVDNIVNVQESFDKASARELKEEVSIGSKVLHSYQLPQAICCDDTAVDRVHIAIVTVHELDGEIITSNEDQLEDLGFMTPQELIDTSEGTVESWAAYVCKILLAQ